jgi:DNA repair protein RadB
MKYLSIKCKPLDNLLGGGIERKTLTEVYGEAGSGKTNLCLQVSRECAVNGEKISYIDTEGISVERLGQICKGYDYKKILSNILFFNPSSFEEQEKMINNAIKVKNLGLVVFDTYNMFYRIKLKNDEESAVRSLNRQLTNLQLAARKKDFHVLLTGQVYSIENNDVRPYAGKGIEHMVKTIIKLEKSSIGKRIATIIKHRSQPKGKKAFFTITAEGLE